MHLVVVAGGTERDAELVLDDVDATLGDLVSVVAPGAPADIALTIDGRMVAAGHRLDEVGLVEGARLGIGDPGAGPVSLPPAGRTVAVVGGVDSGRSVPLTPGGSVMIGRHPDCDLVVADPAVSAHHARIDLGADGRHRRRRRCDRGRGRDPARGSRTVPRRPDGGNPTQPARTQRGHAVQPAAPPLDPRSPWGANSARCPPGEHQSYTVQRGHDRGPAGPGRRDDRPHRRAPVRAVHHAQPGDGRGDLVLVEAPGQDAEQDHHQGTPGRRRGARPGPPGRRRRSASASTAPW